MNTKPAISAQKTRDSNIELLRIIAMLLVLIVHTSFFTIGVPTHAETIAEPAKSSIRFLVQSIAIISVNLFVFISGWYGIRPKMKRFVEFIFQIVFFYAIIFAIFHVIGPDKWTGKTIVEYMLFIEDANWFIKAYIFFFFLSPVINKYVKSASRNSFRWLVIAFFCFQFFYGWYFDGVKWFSHGYSTMSFIGLYLLASYIKQHSTRLIRLPFWINIALWLAMTLATTAITFHLTQSIPQGDIRPYFDYNSPLVIAATVFLFLAFNRLHFKSAIVNWIAISCFAAFLLHCNPAFMDGVFQPVIRGAYTQLSYSSFLAYALVFVLAIFSAAIIIDKIRISVWKLILIISDNLCSIYSQKKNHSN